MTDAVGVEGFVVQTAADSLEEKESLHRLRDALQHTAHGLLPAAPSSTASRKEATTCNQ